MAKKARPPRKRDISSLHPFGHLKQSSILDHLQPMGKSRKRQTDSITEVTTSGAEQKRYPERQSEFQKPHIEEMFEKNDTLELSEPPYSLPPVQKRDEDAEVGPDWHQKANNLLRKHFGYSGLKSFQKEALGAWFVKQDCLVLAATGSGKSLCFQIPALLTGKVVVVISPLISLMHDQCLKLAKHGISACFLGSGQPDNSVEKKAMNGMYSIIYVCPETLLRLICPLQRLAENRGIALFAIDEVHCVSKWGHDFRPDYRRMSVLRESFSASSLDFLKFDIPIMALTATATDHVREDILKSLKLSKDAKVVLTTFFRPNLQFSTMHSRTSPSSYVKDFQELVKVYSNKKTTKESSGRTGSISEDLEDSSEDSDSMSDSSDIEEHDDELNSHSKNGFSTSKERQLSVEFLENDFDDIQTADDFDVSCGEFCGTPLVDGLQFSESTELPHSSPQPAESSQSMSCSLEQGPTIIYVPTRKQTVAIAKYLRAKGVKAEPYNAALPKSHLRRVHKEFHEDALEVVVATIAFGMGIDKLNVRRIIHYGWPQSLEAYYQEAGRAGRDGKLADCTLYANFSKIPTLLPNKRSEEQKRNAYKMLADCYRYGMNTFICRAKVLVEYFGEVFHQKRCMSCDVCRNGPPELQNLKAEANIFMQVIASHYKQQKFAEYSYDDLIGGDTGTSRVSEKPTLRLIVTKIREHSQQFLASDQLWWRGFARLMQDKGFIREGGNMIGVQIKFPEPTNQGLKYLESDVEQEFYAYPEADMLLSADKSQQPFSSFSEWGKGWADPEIRKQRLARKRGFKKSRKSRKRKTRKQSNSMTAKERISARLSKWKK